MVWCKRIFSGNEDENISRIRAISDRSLTPRFPWRKTSFSCVCRNTIHSLKKVLFFISPLMSGFALPPPCHSNIQARWNSRFFNGFYYLSDRKLNLNTFENYLCFLISSTQDRKEGCYLKKQVISNDFSRSDSLKTDQKKPWEKQIFRRTSPKTEARQQFSYRRKAYC